MYRDSEETIFALDQADMSYTEINRSHERVT